MVKISASLEWLQFCTDELKKGKQKAAEKVYKKYRNTVHFAMFMHVDLCQAIYSFFQHTQTEQDAIDFINQSIEEVKRMSKERDND